MSHLLVTDSDPGSVRDASSVVSDTSSSASGRRTRTHRSNLSVLIDELNREVRSNSEDSTQSESGVNPTETPPKQSTWRSFVNILKAIGTVCQVTCPPVPASIIRKVAFHPPAKNSGYRLQLKSEQHRFVESATEVVGKPFSIIPTPMRGLTSRDYTHIMERITATTIKNAQGNDLVVIHVRCLLPSSCESMNRQVVLMTQPNSSDLGHFLQPHCINFPQVADSIGTDLYAFDYSGFGYSTGYPSERHIYSDTLSVFDYVQRENPDHSIVLLGYSIGTAAAVDLAYRKTIELPIDTPNPPLSGMILVAPFTSAIRLLSSQPTRDSTCCFDPFANSDKIANIDLPILIVHGTDDSMVPIEHSTALAQRLRHPLAPFIVQGADHQTVFGCNPSTFLRMSMFVRTETLVGKRYFSAQPAAVSVESVSTRTEKSVPALSRCSSVESAAGAGSTKAKTRAPTPVPSKRKTPKSKDTVSPLKTAKAKTPAPTTAKRAQSPITVKVAAPRSPYMTTVTDPMPRDIAEIEVMQKKIAAI